jgi:hypothetical protein
VNPTRARVPGIRRAGRSGYRVALMTVAAVIVGLLSGCSTSVTYVGSSAQDVFFKVPKTWDVFNTATLDRLGLGPTAANEAAAQGQYTPVFVSAASASANLGPQGLYGPHPWAWAMVITLGSQLQATFTLGQLQDLFFPVDSEQSSGVAVDTVSAPSVIVNGPLRGSRADFEMSGLLGSVAWEQVAWLNSATDKVWAISAGCSSGCFTANRSTLDGIVNSFIVTHRGS